MSVTANLSIIDVGRMYTYVAGGTGASRWDRIIDLRGAGAGVGQVNSNGSDFFL